MSLSSKIKRSVRLAFNKLGDLAIPVTLIQKNATGFNFSTGETTSSNPITKVTKGVLGAVKRKDSTLEKTLLVSSEDITDPDIYDKVTILGVTWNIVPPCENNGFTTKLNIVREAT